MDAKDTFGLNDDGTVTTAWAWQLSLSFFFCVCAGRICANNNHAQLDEDVHQGLWAECATLCTMLDTISTSTEDKSPYHKFYSKPSTIINKLCTFGELGVVKKTTKIQSKLVNKGDLCSFVGYSNNHSSETYRMLNLTTKQIIITQDIRWLNCMLHDLDNAIHLPDTDMEYDEDDLNILEEVPSLHPTADPVHYARKHYSIVVVVG